jgi:hypothetical protein
MGLHNFMNREKRVAGSACGGVALALLCLLGQTAAQDLFDTAIEVRGKLKEVRRNIMIVTREDGTDVSVLMDADPTKLLFSAEAGPQAFHPRMLVRVEAMFGPTGQPVMPITTVELFQPFQAAQGRAPRREDYLPGIYPTDNRPQAPGGFQPGSYRVIGSIVGMAAGGIMVNAGQTRLALPIATEAKWLIRYHDLSLAQPGDPVHVVGFHQPPDETQVKAGTIRIEVDRVIGAGVAATEKGKRRTRRSKEEAPPAAEAPAGEVPAGEVPADANP